MPRPKGVDQTARLPPYFAGCMEAKHLSPPSVILFFLGNGCFSQPRSVRAPNDNPRQPTARGLLSNKGGER